MLRNSLIVLIPILVWGSLGLWGLVVSALIRSRQGPVVLTRATIFRAIACGPISFFLNWRKAQRRDATHERKYGAE